MRYTVRKCDRCLKEIGTDQPEVAVYIKTGDRHYFEQELCSDCHADVRRLLAVPPEEK